MGRLFDCWPTTSDKKKFQNLRFFGPGYIGEQNKVLLTKIAFKPYFRF